MSRANNTARSLQIISKQMGWDPNQIVDTHRQDQPFNPPEQSSPDLYATNFCREDLFEGDTKSGIPSDAFDPQGKFQEISPDGKVGFVTPRHVEHGHSVNSDPYPGMPGARPMGRKR